MTKDIINKAFKVRIYPNPEQAQFINQSCGNSRSIYNYGLELSSKAYKKDKTSLTHKDLANMLPQLKQEREWLKLGPAASLQQSLKDLETSYKRFFNGQARYPAFKKKHNGGSFKALTLRVEKQY